MTKIWDIFICTIRWFQSFRWGVRQICVAEGGLGWTPDWLKEMWRCCHWWLMEITEFWNKSVLFQMISCGAEGSEGEIFTTGVKQKGYIKRTFWSGWWVPIRGCYKELSCGTWRGREFRSLRIECYKSVNRCFQRKRHTSTVWVL